MYKSKVMAHCVMELELTSIVRYQQKRKNIGFWGEGKKQHFFIIIIFIYMNLNTSLYLNMQLFHLRHQAIDT